MRILFLASDYPSPWQPTRGPFNAALVRALRTQHDVRVIAPVSWITKKRHHGTLEAPSIAAHPTYFYPPKVLRRFYDRFYWASARRDICRAIDEQSPDLVLSYWAHPDGAAAVRAARFAGARSAIIVGGSDVLLITKNRARRARIVDALNGADAVIAVSHQLRDATIALGVESSRVHVWSQGIDASSFRPGDQVTARHRVGVAPSERMLLWVGRMVPVKALDVLIDAVSKVSSRENLGVYLIGDGEQRSALARRVARLNLNHVIHFVGPKSAAELGDWYRAADVTVLPSRSEGLPNVLRESLACGTPFLASDVGGISEIARPGVDRLVAPNDPTALARGINEMFRSPSPRSAPKLPTWEQSAKALIEMIAPTQRARKIKPTASPTLQLS